jgi:hypothetical protein
MSAKTPAPVGKTRWRRFGVAAGAGFGVVALILYLTMSGALALNFAFSGIPFSLSADSLTGNRFVQYAVPDKLAQGQTEPLIEGLAGQVSGQGGRINNVEQQTGTGDFYVSDAINQFGNATIAGLNQTVCAPTTSIISGLPNIRVHILGTGDTTAETLTIQAPALRAATARFENINIGKNLGEAWQDQNLPNPYPEYGSNLLGNFAQDATSVRLTDIQQVGIGTEAGVFTIGGLRLWAEFTSTCP